VIDGKYSLATLERNWLAEEFARDCLHKGEEQRAEGEVAAATAQRAKTTHDAELDILPAALKDEERDTPAEGG
jgi:hypothetical protein